MIKNQLKFFIKDKVVFFSIFSAFLLNTFVYLNSLKIIPSSNLISLHYNIYFGVDYVGPWQYIFFIPIGGTIILLLNCLLALFFYFKERLLAYIMLGSIIFIEIVLLVASQKIIWVNT